MKIGKVSQTVLRRSMLKPLKFHREEALLEPSVEEMCYGIRCKQGETTLCSDVVLYGNEKDLGVFALAQAYNHLATRGAKMVGMSVHILLPPYAYESRLKAMVECLEEAGSAHGIQVLSVKAEVSPVIQSAVLHLTGVGTVQEELLRTSAMAKPEQDIVLLKWVGFEGTLRILRQKEDSLKERFVPTFLNQLKGMEEELFSVSALEVAKEYGASAMHQITSGGILAALWELAEASEIGLSVDLKKMSIRQETVEICEYFHLNPYQLTSTGSILLVVDRGEELVEQYQNMGICATLLGRTTRDTARVIVGGEEKRFLDRPAPDELFKLYEVAE